LLAANASVQPTELISHCRTLLGGYKVPKDVFIVSELPRLPTGKIAKTVLRARLRGD
jgi:acyl-CoA synthetase (AMP-forming)/AMP-acid ligase II